MINGVPMPHSRITKYLAGAHAENSGAGAGWNVAVWKNRTITSSPSYTYASWYYRGDPRWSFGDDDNFKSYSWSSGGEPYEGQYLYLEHNPRFVSATSTGAWAGFFGWGNDATNLFAQWIKVEIEVKWSQQSDGRARVWDNGRLVIDYSGVTDKDNLNALISGSSRTDGLGGYARMAGQPNNWRYMADLYLDYSIARVVLGNAPTLAASTIRELQIPTAWSNTSITFQANLGAFASGQTAYVYVVDANGVVSATGRPVVLTSGPPPPAAPTNIRILR
jgi:hypothetical protein